MSSDANSAVWWVIGPVIGIFTAALGHVHVRINRAEDSSLQRHDRSGEQRERDELRLWEALDLHRRDAVAFQREVLTTMATREALTEVREEMRQLRQAMERK